jgi:3-deoxy-D-manno-octulosonate 8-phosphate phosphatase (KDO 8-P phosphatase)
MNVKDGIALQMAVQNGYRVVIVSGGVSEPVIKRFQYLGIEEVHLGVKDKLKFVELFLDQEKITWSETLFIGDDLPDIPVMQKAGLSCCPADAAIDVQEICQYISPFKGGYGCVRDVIEKVLRQNNHWKYTPEISSR